MAAYSDAEGKLSESNVRDFAKACAKFSTGGFKAVDGRIDLEKIDEDGNTVFHRAAF